MAELLWGKVYFKDKFAGYLREEPGEGYSFVYDEDYLCSTSEPISLTLPLQPEPFFSEVGLHPYFDNLVSEGWLASAQARLLGKREVRRFELLLAFGFDCIGAVSIIDPEPAKRSDTLTVLDDPREVALQVSRASLSGVQPKIALIKKGNKYSPSSNKEISTHIAKFPSREFPDLVENEYLTSLAFKLFLNRDKVSKQIIGEVEAISEKALIIERFDREIREGVVERVHFEEFSQLLGLSSSRKYEGDYGDMPRLLSGQVGVSPVDLFQLFKRVVVGLLIGNTDMHFKNFSMFHRNGRLKLTPNYDQVCSILYGYKNSALAIKNAKNLRMTDLKAKHLFQLGEDFKLNKEIVVDFIESLGMRLELVKERILSEHVGDKLLRERIVENLDKQWKITFASIGKLLLKKK